MRVLILALMIALLPLRSWAGDVMAMELAAQSLASGHAPAAPATLADCHQGHGEMAGQAPSPAADEAASDDCGTCTSCQICHSAALAMVLPQALAPALPTLAPQSRQPRYASAEPAPGFKPPIS